MTHKTTLGRLLIILGISVLLRVGVAFYLGNEIDAPPLLTDQRSYDALGTRLIGGYGFSFDRGWYPFTPANTPTAHWSFLYSLFVAAVYTVFGPHPLAVRIVQAILGGVLLPLMVYVFARRIYRTSPLSPLASKLSELGFSGEHLGLWAAGLAAIYFYFVLYAATVMTETFYITGMLWMLIEAISLAERPTFKHGMWFGLSLALTTLLRQSILPWIAVLALWLLWLSWRMGLLRAMLGKIALALGILGLAILPFTVRNYLVFHQFLLLNSNAGYAMYSAQHPMHGTTFQAFEAAPVPPELNGLNEAQLDRELMSRGIGFVLADPGRYLQLSLSRVTDYFEFWPSPTTSLLNNIGRVGSIGVLLPFMLYGIWLAWTYTNSAVKSVGESFLKTPTALCLMFIVFYSLLHIFTWAMPRYRLPVDAVAMPFAALALSTLTRLVMHRLRHR